MWFIFPISYPAQHELYNEYVLSFVQMSRINNSHTYYYDYIILCRTTAHSIKSFTTTTTHTLFC